MSLAPTSSPTVDLDPSTIHLAPIAISFSIFVVCFIRSMSLCVASSRARDREILLRRRAAEPAAPV